MTDQNTPDVAAPRPETVVGLITDGAYSLIVARFPTTDSAEDAYRTLTDLERRSSLRIDGVVVASRDADGKVHLGKVTEHSTKTGLKWGLVGGVALGLIFPPSILAGAVAGGAIGAAIGKVGNLSSRSDLSKELEGVLTPGSSGVIALVEDTAVVEIQKALAEADAIVTKAVDKQLAAAIDREAALAKESLGT
ncbi:MAG: hypothetical protein K0S97_2463 [Chloroflexota bacterium]|jgi:uncharacterized membrane protein|nr:hypothetical protein [Chloroflexota bacterium]